MKVKVGGIGFHEGGDSAPDLRIVVGGEGHAVLGLDKFDDGIHEDGEEQPSIKVKVGSPIVSEEGEEGADITIRVNPTVDEDLEGTDAITVRVNPTVDEDQEEAGAIKISVGEPDEDVSKIKIKIGSKEETIQKSIKLIARRAINGDVMVFDHKDIDIILKLSKGKVVCVPKDEFDDKIYETQLRFFEFLSRKGLIEYEAIQGGNMFFAMEAKLLESDDFDIPQIALVTIGNWIEQERPYFEWQERWEEEEERRLTEPPEGDTTEFDEERHSPDKGASRRKMTPYGTPGIYRF